MKKQYEPPRIEKIEFDNTSFIASSSNHGGIYREFTDQHYGCKDTPTDNWINPYSIPNQNQNV